MAEGARAAKDVFARTHPQWVQFFKAHGLYAQALQQVPPTRTGETAPSTPLPFEAFGYAGPADTKVVLLGGRDLYRTGIRGLAPGGAPPPPIMRSLERQGLARPPDPKDPPARRGDLRPWAVQGALLLDPAAAPSWGAFVRAVLKGLAAKAAAADRPLVVMAWGGAAIEHAPAPSPCVRVCLFPGGKDNIAGGENGPEDGPAAEDPPHFVAANEALVGAGLRPIEWDLLAPTVAFTDGACKGNGRADAVASYAVWVSSGPLGGVGLQGTVPPHAYRLVDPADPARGFAPDPATAATPTNNRGEYLAWCWALLLLLRGGVRGRTEVVSDCKLFIMTMEAWLPARRAKGTERALKNYDLIQVADALLGALRAENRFGAGGVRLTHVRSHRPRPRPDAGPRARALWEGNDRVDRMAAGHVARAALKEPHHGPELSCDGAMRFRLLGGLPPRPP